MDAHVVDENAVRWLYQQLLEWWNQRNAAMMVALFDQEGIAIGYDGTQMTDRAEIHRELSRIFESHETQQYVWKIKDVKLLSDDVAMLHAVVGMIPNGQTDIDPTLNAIQVLTAVKKHGGWFIATFQNTPAAFHEKPRDARKLTAELQRVVAEKRKAFSAA